MAMKRRTFLKTSAAASAFPLFDVFVPQARAGRLDRPMNVVIFITDQERAVQHFPAGWANRHLPSSSLLARNGITFNQACCSAAMCSPSRATFFTGLFPAQHGVKDTIEPDVPDYPVQQLPLNIPNLADVMEAAGYEVVFKGKWHLSLPPTPRLTPFSDALEPYRFSRWNPPDAGENTDLDQFGAGNAENDRRIIFGRNQDIQMQEGANSFIRKAAIHGGDRPFCLIVSLVNPHDVLSYPDSWLPGGYGPEWFVGNVGLPETLNESLDLKPTAQKGQIPGLNALGVLETTQEQLNYINFYANLMSFADRQLLSVYRTLEREGFLDSTLIVRTSDHGEMGLAHGGLRQKNFNVYEETLRVPLVFSNPVLFPGAYQSDALVSHVDFLPTLASLVRSPLVNPDWQGRDYSHIINGRGAGLEVQDYTLYTFDDIRTGQNVEATAPPPNHIVGIRERGRKFATYYDPDGDEEPEYEMYDMLADPLEVRNLANPYGASTKLDGEEFWRLEAKLNRAWGGRLQPLKQDLIPEPRTF